MPINQKVYAGTTSSGGIVVGAPAGSDGEDGDPGIPGQAGAAGATGNPGTPGQDAAPAVRAFDGTDGDDGWMGVPGERGDRGDRGDRGCDGGDGDDGAPGGALPSGMVTRAMVGPDAKNWAFLGTIAGTGVTVGPLVWTGQYQQIYFEYIIGGYSGGTPVGRILCGAAAIATTGLTNGNGLNENGTNNATSVSVPGCPLAVTLSAIARSGYGFISGASGAFKQLRITGQSGNPAVATSPTVFHARSFFSDLGTNLLIQRLQLSVYDTLIATALSANTFTATTQLWAWGRFND